MVDNGRKTSLDLLPGSLNQALNALEQDEVICEALGPHICDRFINAKRLEWEDFRMEVTDWELEKYLSNY
jgi:glutamine synthetase